MRGLRTVRTTASIALAGVVLAVTLGAGPAGAGLNCAPAGPDGEIQRVPNAYIGNGMRYVTPSPPQTVLADPESGETQIVKFRFRNHRSTTQRIVVNIEIDDPQPWGDVGIKYIVNKQNLTAKFADGRHGFKNVAANASTPVVKMKITGTSPTQLDYSAWIAGEYGGGSCHDVLSIVGAP